MGSGADDASGKPQETRWHYRLAHFSRAYGLLREAMAGDVDELTALEMEGVIQRFEYTVELGWKLLKDRLEHDSVVLTGITPKKVVRAAFQARLIEDGDAWIDMLDDRNRTSHVYDEDAVHEVVRELQSRYLTALGHLHEQSLQARQQ